MRRYYARFNKYWAGPGGSSNASVHKQNARPSKVLTTERLVFFSDDYEIESGQGSDTASVHKQNARP